jgi:hypothetical protein
VLGAGTRGFYGATRAIAFLMQGTKAFCVAGLGKIFDSPGLQDARSDSLAEKPGDEHYWDAVPVSDQSGLQVRTTHAGQLYVADEAIGARYEIGEEVLLGRSKRGRGVTERGNEPI